MAWEIWFSLLAKIIILVVITVFWLQDRVIASARKGKIVGLNPIYYVLASMIVFVTIFSLLMNDGSKVALEHEQYMGVIFTGCSICHIMLISLRKNIYLSSLDVYKELKKNRRK